MGQISESSKIILGLPDDPDSELDPRVYSQFKTLISAIKNLARGVSQYAGVDADPEALWSQISPANSIITQNHTRIYPQATVTITAGQMVNLFLSGGVVKARLASASSISTMAHGVAMTSAIAGQTFQMYWLRGYVDVIGGMTAGTLYWLSTVSGFVQNTKPAAAGNIQQPIGLALGVSSMIMDIPLSVTQL